MGYRAYEIEGNPDMLYRPFVNVYFGAAYIKWLSSCDGKYVHAYFCNFRWHILVPAIVCSVVSTRLVRHLVPGICT